MKRTLFWAAIATMALVSCSVREEMPAESAPDVKVLTIEATRDAGDTRTSYAGEKTFAWSVGDKISVLCNDGTSDFLQTFTATAADATSAFTATVPANVNLGPRSSSGYRLALFPASDDHQYAASWSIQFHIPVERDFREAAGGHLSADVPMFAWGTDGDLYRFANMTGAAKFSFSGIPCSSVKFQFTAARHKLNGDFKLYNGGDGQVHIDDSSNIRWNTVYTDVDSERTVTYYADVTDGMASFYLPYVEGEIAGPSTLTLSDAVTGAVLYSNDKVKTIRISKNRIAVLPTLEVEGSVPAEVDIDLSFHESADDVKNPERGLYKMVEYFYHRRDGSSTSTTASLTDSYNNEGTLVMTLFYLFDFVDSDHISPAGLQYVRDVLANVRKQGKKAIVRFAYNNEHPSNYHQEPTKDQILNHLTDLQPVLSEYEDVIYVVQAGFIGTYGEWYYTTNFSRFQGNKESRDFTVDGNVVTGFENRAAVLDALLAAVPESRQIELRTPFYKRYYLNPNSISTWTPLTGPGGTDANARLAFHNDAFLAGSDDMGTYHHSADRPMWEQQSAWLICGGEAPYGTSYSLDYGDTYEEVRAALCDYHYSYLHHDTAYHTGNSGGSRMMKYWHEQGWMPDIKKLLGYRLYLETARIEGEGLTAGSSVHFTLTLHNSGAAPVMNARPMKLVLLHSGAATILADQVGDIRLVESLSSKSYTVTVTLPQDIVAGDRLALWLPDAAETLQSTPAYSIRLANSDVTWEAGYNVVYSF